MYVNFTYPSLFSKNRCRPEYTLEARTNQKPRLRCVTQQIELEQKAENLAVRKMTP